MESSFFETTWFQWGVVPILVFVAKLVEVSIGTLRLIFLARGEKKIVPFVAFVEVLIWISLIGVVLTYLTNVMAYLAYALGFAVGNRVGMMIEGRMALGNSMIRVITRRNAQKLINYLKKEKYPITTIAARSNRSKVNLIYILIRRKNLKKLVIKIKQFNPRAFFSVEDVSVVNEGMMPFRTSAIAKTPLSKRLWGKSK